MVKWSDRPAHSKSMNRLMATDGAAAAESGSEGKTVRRVLFPDEAETSRRCEQRRRELIHQHENPQKPTPLMDLNVEVHSDLNVKVRSGKRSKSMNHLTGHSEKEECTRTVHFIPAGSESTHRQQQGAKPKQLTVSISFRTTNNRTPPPMMPPMPSGPAMPLGPPMLPPSWPALGGDLETASCCLQGTRPWKGKKRRSGMRG